MSAPMLAQLLALACGLATCEPAPAPSPSVTPCPRCAESHAMDSTYTVALRRARSATRDGAWNQAAELWRDALLIDDRAASHWMVLGDVLLHAERHREAVAAYQRGVQLDARFTERGTRGVARSYARMGDDRQAIRWLEQALRLGARADDLWRDESLRHYRDEPRLRGVMRRQVDRRGDAGAGEQHGEDSRAASTSVCDFCLAGPGSHTVRENRVDGGGIPAVLILPFSLVPVPPHVEQYPLPPEALLTASVIDNDVRGHTKRPVGVALRIGAIGVDASDVAGTSNVTFTDNDLTNNTFGIIVEAAFVRAGTRRRGDITLSTSGNTITGSCQADLLVALSASPTALGLASGPYLTNSTFALTLGGDISFDDAWYAHAAGQGNALTVNGQVIPNGVRRAFDASRICVS